MSTRVNTRPIDQAVWDRVWDLHIKHDLRPTALALRFPMNVKTIQRELRERRKAAGMPPMEMTRGDFKTTGHSGAAAPHTPLPAVPPSLSPSNRSNSNVL